MPRISPSNLLTLSLSSHAEERGPADAPGNNMPYALSASAASSGGTDFWRLTISLLSALT